MNKIENLKDLIIYQSRNNENIEIQYFKQNPVGKSYKKLGFVANDKI